MSEQTGARVGLNEALFREVNERIEGLQSDLGSAGTFYIVCECGTAACTERFPITREEYLELREDPRRFAVVPGHQAPEVEQTLVERTDYFVVEKTDPDAVEAVEETAEETA